jgi:hypothetical protein
MSEPTKTAEPTTVTTEPATPTQRPRRRATLPTWETHGKKALNAERDRAQAAEKSAADLQKQLDEINRRQPLGPREGAEGRTDAQEAAQQATAEALRLRVAAKHGISDEDADLFLTGTDGDPRAAGRTPGGADIPAPPPDPDPTSPKASKGGAGATDKASLFAQLPEPDGLAVPSP